MDDREERPPEASIGTRRGKVECAQSAVTSGRMTNSEFQPETEELVLMDGQNENGGESGI